MKTANGQSVMGPTVVKISISLDPELYRQAKMAAELAGYKFSFSGFTADALRDRVWQNKRLRKSR